MSVVVAGRHGGRSPGSTVKLMKEHDRRRKVVPFVSEEVKATEAKERSRQPANQTALKTRQVKSATLTFSSFLPSYP